MEPHVAAALLLSALIGVSLGMLGGGGSILAVPVLVYVARLPVREAVAMSLAVVGATSLAGASFHGRHGRVSLRAALVFGGAGMLGAPLGAQVTPLVAPQALLLLFGLLMIAVATLMLRPRPLHRAHGPRPPAWSVPAAGFGVGLLTGFLGVGGGFLIVPGLVLLAGLPMHEAVGTSLAVIALNSAAGLVGHLGHGFPLGLAGAFTASSVVGALVGERLAGRLDPLRLRRGFGLFVLVVGLLLAIRNAAALRG